MRDYPTPSQKGQVLIFVAFAIAALIAFAALVVDGGSIYNTRRTAQNAADAAALAGASEVSKIVTGVNNKTFKCNAHNFNTARARAITTAQDNNYVIENNLSNNNGVDVQCVGNQFVDVTVRITEEVEVYLIHMIGLTPPVNTVEAVVRVTPKNLFADGAAIMATRENCGGPQSSEGGVWFNGGISIDVTGTIKSNACCRVQSNSSYINLTENWVCDSSDITYGNSNITPGPPVQGMVDGIDVTELNTQLLAACGSSVGAPNHVISGNVTFTPTAGSAFKINNLEIKNNGKLKMNPGLYCIFGKLLVSGQVQGTHVTIFMSENAGKIDLSGSMVISAPVPLCEFSKPSCSPAVGGLLLLYMPDDEALNPARILTMSGNSSNNYTGSIIAPNTKIKMNGSGVVQCDASRNKSQLIGETIEIDGNGSICLNYNANYTMSNPGLLNLMR